MGKKERQRFGEGRMETHEERTARTSDLFRPFQEKIAATVTELGYECVNVAPATEGGRPVLRVLIDSLGGINVGDCERVSKAINRYLDGGDAEVSERYYLEVSSPGIERPLFTPADYERFKNREARIRTQELVGGRKTHVGFIRASDGASVTLETEQGEETLLFAGITRAVLVFRGPGGDPGPGRKTPRPNTPKRSEKPGKEPGGHNPPEAIREIRRGPRKKTANSDPLGLDIEGLDLDVEGLDIKGLDIEKEEEH